MVLIKKIVSRLQIMTIWWSQTAASRANLYLFPSFFFSFEVIVYCYLKINPAIILLEIQFWLLLIQHKPSWLIYLRVFSFIIYISWCILHFSVGSSGTYIIRKSRNAGQGSPFTLTIYYNEVIFHINIRLLPCGKFALGKSKVDEMVSTLFHY